MSRREHGRSPSVAREGMGRSGSITLLAAGSSTVRVSVKERERERERHRTSLHQSHDEGDIFPGLLSFTNMRSLSLSFFIVAGRQGR